MLLARKPSTNDAIKACETTNTAIKYNVRISRSLRTRTTLEQGTAAARPVLRCTSRLCTGTPRTWRFAPGRSRGSSRPGWRRSDRNTRAPTAGRWPRSRTTRTGWTDSGTRAAGAVARWRTTRTRRRPCACRCSTPVRRSCVSGTRPSGHRGYRPRRRRRSAVTSRWRPS